VADRKRTADRLGIAEALGPEGALARKLPGFACRPQQLELAEAVATALADGQTLIAEAGTGTGKTFAYLVPALLSGRKVIVSTGTRNLQDQLYLRDLPMVREALASPARIALLKGRANYLCEHRLGLALGDTRGFPAEVAGHLAAVRNWARMTSRGDLSELSMLPEQSMVWPLVSSTRDNCLGSDCPDWNDCWLVAARRQALEADLVVINHHLLCADLALRDDGFGELLPEADAFILDEAHQLPEVAGDFFGHGLSLKQLLDLARDTEREYRRAAGDLPELLDRCDRLSKAARDLRLAFGIEPRRGAWGELRNDRAILPALDDLDRALGDLAAVLERLEGRDTGLDKCRERNLALQAELHRLAEPEPAASEVRWFETFSQGLRLSSTPLEIAEPFQQAMAGRPASWIFTSATLAVGDSFAHFQAQLGIEDAVTRRWDSPFDFARQALWYVPHGMPDPRDSGFTQAVLEAALPVVEASHGRAFLLFTSLRALRQAADWLRGRIEFPLLVQGDAPKDELLRRFREAGNAVLLGSASFWEGVDVRGEALSLVVIDKLPFAAPNDPVLKARLDAITARGRNAFLEYQVPQAAIALKQGAGRLIRGPEDRGVLMLCDPRLLRRSYGHVLLGAMPPFARTRSLAEVLAFFRETPAPAGEPPPL